MHYVVKINDTIRGIKEEQDFDSLVESVEFIWAYKEDGVFFAVYETTENKFSINF